MRSPWHRREGKWIHEEPGLVHLPLCDCLPLPFLPSHHPHLRFLLQKTAGTIRQERTHLTQSRCMHQQLNSFGFIKATHVCVCWQQINKHALRVSIKICSLTSHCISSAVSFVWKCLQGNNKNANTQKVPTEVDSVGASSMACLNICSSAPASDSWGRPLCQRPVCHACEQKARHCAVNPIRLHGHTLTPFCRPERGQGKHQNQAISPR